MSLKGITVLVIDDDDSARKQLTMALQQQGAHVLGSASVDSGLRCLLTQEVDAVLCDLIAPINATHAFIRRITDMMPLVPFLVISEQSEAAEIAEAMHKGAWDYFLKHITSVVVLEHALVRHLRWAKVFEENRHYRQVLETKNHELRESLSALEHDQHAGKEVQKHFLPKTPYRLLKCSVEYKLLASLYISGDFVDYFKLTEDQFFFYLADVSGHGASSAFITILLKTAVMRMKRDFKRGQDDLLLKPADFLRRLNQEVIQLKLGKHITMVVGVMNKQTRELTYSVAGHLPLPILKTEGKTRYLAGRGMPVGLFDEPMYTQQCIEIPAPFTLTLFSDGILELLTQKSLAQKEQFLLESVQQYSASLTTLLGYLGLANTPPDLPDDVAVMMIREKE